MVEPYAGRFVGATPDADVRWKRAVGQLPCEPTRSHELAVRAHLSRSMTRVRAGPHVQARDAWIGTAARRRGTAILSARSVWREERARARLCV